MQIIVVQMLPKRMIFEYNNVMSIEHTLKCCQEDQLKNVLSRVSNQLLKSIVLSLLPRRLLPTCSLSH